MGTVVAFCFSMVQSVRATFFLASLLSMLSAFASPLCEELYRLSPKTLKSDLSIKIEDRLEAYFGQQWHNGESLSDAKVAKEFFKKLKTHGSIMDLKFFDLYLSVRESTSGHYEVRAPGFYIDLLMGFRPKSNFFQERHWDWSILDGYFFNGPLPVSIVKEQDFQYMRHILKTALEMGKVTLREVLQQANHTWALKTIDAKSKLGWQYREFVKGKTYDLLFEKFRAKVEHWIKSGRNENERKTRAKIAQASTLSYKSSNSHLDLFIANKYFDLINTYGVSGQYWPHSDIPKWLQLTDWRVYEMSLPYASMEYLNDFLFQNSHDIKAKEYLLRILYQMETTPVKKFGDFNGFFFGFLEAHAYIGQSVGEVKAPEHLQTDLHIFSKRRELVDGFETYDQMRVNWNPVFSRPQANVVNHKILKSSELSTVETDPQLRSNVKQYFDQLRENKTFTEAEIARDENLELSAPLVNTTYLSFTMPGTERMLTLVRLFDGTHDKTYIEREFPNITLPRGKDGEKTLELGRLLAKNEVEEKAIWPVMAMVAEYLKMANISGDVYFDCARGPMKYYKSLGAEIVHTPGQLNIEKGNTPVWVMKLSVADIIRIFSKPEYRSIKLKKSASSYN